MVDQMAADDLDELLLRMESIAKSVEAFSSEAVQQQALAGLLAAFSQGASGTSSDERRAPDPTASSNEDADAKPSRKQTRRARSPEKAESPTGLDALSIVNSIKEDPRYEIFRDRIIIADTTRAQKVKFVSWFTHDARLTSGDIQRVLQGLGVKIDAPTASKAMADASGDYLKEERGRHKTYHLTTRGHAEFEKWLMNGESD